MRTRKVKRIAGILTEGAFTLPEVLVTIALIAILAAVVVPTIANQVKKGDPNRVGSDMVAIRGAVEQFLSDVRKYPNSIGQLTNSISTSQAPLGTSTTYGSGDVTRWKGPYVTKDSIGMLTTGFGISLKSAFDTCTLGTSGTSSTAGGIKYLIISMAPIDSASWLLVDNAIDEGTGTQGSVRYRYVDATHDTLKFLAMPIQP